MLFVMNAYRTPVFYQAPFDNQHLEKRSKTSTTDKSPHLALARLGTLGRLALARLGALAACPHLARLGALALGRSRGSRHHSFVIQHAFSTERPFGIHVAPTKSLLSELV